MSVVVVFARRTATVLPKFWRKPLSAAQKLTCQTIHWDLLSRFTDGTGTRDDLWDWMETGLTYHQFMRYLDADGTDFTQEALDAVVAQLASYESVVARFARAHRVGFNAQELAVARAAAEVFDGLLELDRNGYADQAARWSTQTMAKVWRVAR